MWGLVPAEITGLTINDVTVDSNINGNRDGIDVVDSHDVLIERVEVHSVDGATVAQASFRRITVDDSLRAVFVLIGKRNGALRDPSWISGLRFEDITAAVGDRNADYLSTGVVVSGTAYPATTHRVHDVLLSNVRITVTAPSTAAAKYPPEYDGTYPESDRWHWLAAYGFFFRHADGVTVRGSSATAPSPGSRPLSTTIDVVNYSLS